MEKSKAPYWVVSTASLCVSESYLRKDMFSLKREDLGLKMDVSDFLSRPLN